MQQQTDILPHAKLILNTQCCNLEECWAFGYECADQQMDEMENPYTKNSAEFIQWQEGWWAGFYGEEPLYEVAAGIEQSVASVPVSAPASTAVDAANEWQWDQGNFTKWSGRILKVTGLIIATVVGYQLLDLAV